MVEHLKEIFVGIHTTWGRVYSPPKILAAIFNHETGNNTYGEAAKGFFKQPSHSQEILVPNFDPPKFDDVYDSKKIRTEDASG